MEDKDRKTTRHTWIGDKDEVSIGEMPAATRIVERQKKPYTGFITHEELKNDRIIEVEDKSTRVVSREETAETRVYTPFQPFEPEAAAEEPEAGSRREPSFVTIRTGSRGVRRGLIAAACIVILVLLFDMSFFIMRSRTAKLPGETEAVRTETEEMTSKNEEIESEIASYGNYEQMEELKESWQRLEEKLEPSE